MTFGSFLIQFAGLAGVVAVVAAVAWARGNAVAERGFRLAYLALTVALGLACVLLMTAILNHDYRFEYVAGYSSNDLPLLYLISAFWGGQQGTFLLWAFVAALIGIPLYRKRSWEPATVMAFYVPTILFQIALMLDQGGNPFKLLPAAPPDGRGLNPLLQDPWMATHPPLVFVGYAAMTVPAALAFAAVARREEGRWLDTALRWSLLGFLTLGGGIILGGFWAYKVLGWGGYWGWDPVENASLVPWIVVTALLHGLLIQKFTGGLPRTNLALAFGGFLTVLYATFLTRSGVLADFSVHSFPKGSLYRVLVTILLVVLVAAIAALVMRKGKAGRRIDVGAAWPFLLSSVIVLFAVSAFMVLVGTSMPILSSIAGKPFTPQPSFYNTANLPVYLLALLLLGVAPFSAWRKDSWREWNRGWWFALAGGAVGTIAAIALGARGPLFLALLFAALMAVVANLIRFVQVARVRALHVGAAVAHLGFALLFVGILASSAWDREVDEVALPIGQPVEVLGHVMTYRGHVDGSQPKDLWRVAIMEPGEAERVGTVRMYQVASGSGEGSLMRNPAILRSWTRDVYIAPLGLDFGHHTVDLAQGRPVGIGGAALTFLGFQVDSADDGGHMQVLSRVRIETPNGEPEEIALAFVQTPDGGLFGVPATPDSLGGATTLRVERMSVEQRSVQVLVEQGAASETLTVHAAIKPGMNLVWAGTILMALGCTIAAIRRFVERGVAAVPAEAGGRREAAA